MIHWKIGWLIDWLIDWLIEQIIDLAYEPETGKESIWVSEWLARDLFSYKYMIVPRHVLNQRTFLFVIKSFSIIFIFVL